MEDTNNTGGTATMDGPAPSSAPPPTDSAPDLSGLNPGAPPQLISPGIVPTAPVVGMGGSPTMRAAANIPPPQPLAAQPGQPHAGLVNMLSGLFLGMDAFAKAAATGGREGGVQEVLDARTKQQELQLRSDANSREASESKFRIQHLQAQTNLATAQLELNRQKMPLELQKLNLDYTRLWLETAKDVGIPALFAVEMIPGQSMQDHMNGIDSKSGGDLVNNAVIPAHAGEYGKGGASYGFSFDKLRAINLPIEKVTPLLNNLQNQIDYAKGVEGYQPSDAIQAQISQAQKANAPPQQVAKLQADLGFSQAVQTAQAKLDLMRKGSSINGADFTIFSQNLQSNLMAKVAQKTELAKFETEQANAVKAKQAADPLFKLENDPSEMQGEKAASAVPMLMNKLSDPNISPDDKARVIRLVGVATVARSNYLEMKSQEEKNSQAIKDGDPTALARMLVNGLVAPSEIISARNSSFASKVLTTAQSLDSQWSPQKAEAQYQYAKNPTVQGTLNMIASLTGDKTGAGTLKLAGDYASQLPQGDIPALNDLKNWAKFQTGHPELAAFRATMLGVADEYSKVMGGGQGTDSARDQAVALLNSNFSKEQAQAAIQAVQLSLVNRKNAMVRDNPTLQRLYPEASTATGAEPSRPANVPSNYVYQKTGPKGEGWYKP